MMTSSKAEKPQVAVHHLNISLQSIKTKEAAATAGGNYRVAGGRRRRRVVLSREISVGNSFRYIDLQEGGYHREEAAAAVPFVWESTPGTPKHQYCQTTTSTSTTPPPPLTPPPCYLYYSLNTTTTTTTTTTTSHDHIHRSSISSYDSPRTFLSSLISKKQHKAAALDPCSSSKPPAGGAIFPRPSPSSLKKDPPPTPTPTATPNTTATAPSSPASSSTPSSTSPSPSRSLPSSPKFHRRSSAGRRRSSLNQQQQQPQAAAEGEAGSPVSTLCFGSLASSSSNRCSFRACYSTLLN